jgi:phage-related tail fiber protein
MIDSNSQFYAILTNVGVAKQANADALGVAWKITQMGVGDANGTDPQPNAAQKTLINEWRRAPLNQLKQDPTNAAIIIAEQVIPAEIGGKWIREIGLYDADGDLVAVANCAPSFKPLLAQGSGRTQVVRMNLIVSNSASVELKIDPSVVLATREFVTSELAKQDFKHSAWVAAPANIALTGLQTIDGVVVPAGKRVLVPKQTAGKDNGIWVAASGAWTRATDADTSEKVTPGLLVHVEQGTLYGDSGWQLVTDGTLTVGVTSLGFEMAWGRTGVVAGTYRSVTVDKYGRVVSATNPTTVAGYGLTDVYTTTQIDGALALKAPLDSPTFIGVAKAPTPAAATNTDQIATTAFVKAAITALIGGAPGALDALNEIAAAMGNDPNFAATMTNALALKAPLSSPTLTGDPKAPTAAATDNDTSIANTAFVRLAMALFGLGTDTAPEAIDANDMPYSGMYRLNANASNIPMVANATILCLRFNNGGAMQLFNALSGTGGTARMFWRTQAAGGWTVWREVGGLDSPALTGNPTAPTPAVGDNDTSLATTAFVYSVLSSLGIAPNAVNANILAAGTDLNSVVTYGVYSQPTVANATLALNYPKVTAGTLTVSRGSATFVNQLFQEYNTGQVWTRSIYNGAASAWLLSASIDSPVFIGDPKAPTPATGDNDTSIATTAFVQAAMAVFGVGISSPSIVADLNAAIQSGFYRTVAGTTQNQPVASNCSLIVASFNGGGCFQLLSPLGTPARVLWRAQAAGTWSAWREAAATDSPALTGSPTAPTPALGDNSTLIATTEFANTAIRGAVGLMTGMVGMFAMSTPPAGWLKRNGAAVSRTTYSALFAKIGTLYGAGDGSTTFNLPDSRGYFDRAWDDGRNVDTGRGFGSDQASQNLLHGHTATAANAGAHTHTSTLPREYVPPTDGVNVNAVYGDQINEGTGSIATSSAGTHTHGITVADSGGNESRPVNTAFLACIKY